MSKDSQKIQDILSLIDRRIEDCIVGVRVYHKSHDELNTLCRIRAIIFENTWGKIKEQVIDNE